MGGHGDKERREVALKDCANKFWNDPKHFAEGYSDGEFGDPEVVAVLLQRCLSYCALALRTRRRSKVVTSGSDVENS